MKFLKLLKKNNIYIIQKTKKFEHFSFNSTSNLKKILNFSLDMTFNNIGEHRVHRSGGSYLRKNGEIFSDVFQGKLAEFAFYDLLSKKYSSINEPNLERYKKGIWDTGDFIINQKHISIKSAKYFSNLLLLETKDWDKEGNYLPNLGEKKINAFIFVRIKPDISSVLKNMKLYYSNGINQTQEDNLKNEILRLNWYYDIPGYLNLSDIILAIESCNIIKKGDFLNSYKTKIDADNYYFHTCDMRDIKKINF